MPAFDFLIIGAGIVGLTIACELKRRDPNASVTVLEKEGLAGLHSSGRNSGELHSGIYYPSAARDADRAGVALHYKAECAAFDERAREVVLQDRTRFAYHHLVNAAGLHADRVAHRLLPRLRSDHPLSCGKVTMRAQLYGRAAGRLINDFLVSAGESSTHVLNAVSPA